DPTRPAPRALRTRRVRGADGGNPRAAPVAGRRDRLRGWAVKIGYADPPYVGCAHLYRDHPDYAGEVDHAALIDRLQAEFDGWVLHASATPTSIATLAPLVAAAPGARWMAWVKGFAAFKRNVPVAYAWEPVIVKPARKQVVSKRLVMRDWIQESITLRR